MQHANVHSGHEDHGGHRHPMSMKKAAPPAGHTGGDHHGGHDHAHMITDFRRRFWVSLVLTFPVLLLSHGFWELFGLKQPLRFLGDQYAVFVMASIIYFYGGWPFLAGMAVELKQRKPGMMTLIAVAVSAAYFYSTAVVFGLPGMGFYWELATLIDVMLLGHWIEMRSIMGASGALEALVRLLPSDAHQVKPNGDVEDVPITALVIGDRVLIKPGEKVPTDGVIIAGRSSVNESMLTGESKPVEKNEGNEVIGGSVNGEGVLTIEIRKTGDKTYLSQIIDMVRRAQESRSRTQDLANRAAVWLTIIALAGGAITITVWLLLGQGFNFAIERAVTVMVISCPHALGLAVPLVVAVSTTLSARHGLLIRDRAAFERARNLQAVVFDKTGTLTEGRFGVSDVVTLADLEETQSLALAAALESNSSHPIAAGIVQEARRRALTLPAVENVRNLPGRGLEALIEGHTMRVVSPGYLREHNIVISDERVKSLGEQGKTVVFVLRELQPLAALALADVVRAESREAVHRLQDMGIRCMMLTGDAQTVAAAVGKELGLDYFFAEVLPDQKAAQIRAVRMQGLTVAMVGDGVNDAPALVEADLGIAIGAGTEVAVESADVVLVRNDPRDVAAILELSRATYRKMVQNLWWATGYNAVAIPLAAGVAAAWGILLQPALGAAFMSVSTVIVAINAKLLERSRI